MAVTARFLARFGPKSVPEILMPCKGAMEMPAPTTFRHRLHHRAATVLLLVATTTIKTPATREATNSLLQEDTTHRRRLTSTTRVATTRDLPKAIPAQAMARLLRALLMVLLPQDNGTPLPLATAAPATALLKATARVPVALLTNTRLTNRDLPRARDHPDGTSTPDRVLATRVIEGRKAMMLRSVDDVGKRKIWGRFNI